VNDERLAGAPVKSSCINTHEVHGSCHDAISITCECSCPPTRQIYILSSNKECRREEYHEPGRTLQMKEVNPRRGVYPKLHILTAIINRDKRAQISSITVAIRMDQTIH
jgi:hypothetical protein